VARRNHAYIWLTGISLNVSAKCEPDSDGHHKDGSHYAATAGYK
jgi:hypothetical protein